MSETNRKIRRPAAASLRVKVQKRKPTAVLYARYSSEK